MPLADSLRRARSEVQGLTGDLRGARREMDGLDESARSVAEASGVIPEILRRGRGPLPPGTASGLGPRGGAIDLGAKSITGSGRFAPASTTAPSGGLVSPAGRPLGSGGGGGSGGGLTSSTLIAALGGAGPPTSREMLDELCERVTWRLPARIGQTEGDEIEGWVCPWGATYADPETWPEIGRRLGSRRSGGTGRSGGGRRRVPGTGFEGTLGAGGLREANPTAGVARGGSDARAATGKSTQLPTAGERQMITELRGLRRSVDRLSGADAGAIIRGRI